MRLAETMRTQRVIRRLKPDLLDDALMLRLIELALKAPTGQERGRFWEFVLVKDRHGEAPASLACTVLSGASTAVWAGV